MKLGADDPYVRRGYGQERIEPGQRPAVGCVRATIVDAFSNNFRTIVPEDCVGDHEQGPHEANLRDVHRRHAEVTTSDEVLAYLAELAVPA